MTKEKQTGDIAMWVIYILIALLFGAFLGSPVPDVWAGRISEMISSESEAAVKSEGLHSKAAAYYKAISEDKSSVYGKAVSAGRTAAYEKTIPAIRGFAYDKLIAADRSAIYDMAAERTAYVKAASEDKTAEIQDTKADTGEAAGSGIQMIVSDPSTSEIVEAQPDYIVFGANRGGVADRKELDVLIHLINAEAYGLSYKAKVAVGQVVMNRWTGPYYGDDLMAIMTAPYQFTPIHNGSAYKKKIEPDSIQAANAVLAGTGVKELTGDTYYFVNPDFTEDKTIEREMQFVCEIEGLHFFKPPAK